MTSATDLHGDPHVERYLETNGEDGYHWRNGTTILILFTKGRKSGEQRSHALIFRPHGDAYLVVASKGGSDAPPAWFLNLQADPDVEVQVKGERFRARARVATPEEKPEMWSSMVEVWPDYEDYQRSTSREIPVVVLERAGDTA
ncbi:nitroreductase family deazaflavin-dependent oxidoreductase [Paenibacillus sp. TRM 82003]|uniref:nitroreductase family deazaflavin-dependent oxidoreductase n=1 Tax=Kineococcus sp. TRM81007 TaxID=2925831 RepID=UPI001F57AA18|nr:nitroreductase family deazaflavin-dependent oxidoreductase [Kineococcus sp. TRM81007]MCI2237134.1 nitroreductase family deazaflavin-dependent oxidoreductase [Kineococcus sp. TRM81007]MCI3925255.1 nitroreductase family deazaflavin-dependent oxidoreductase [Paenibacillus sp. TRM 82003]